MKKCTKCNEEKEVSYFRKKKGGKDGLHSQCKSCDKEYRKDNKEYMKEYRKANKERIKEYQIEYQIKYHKEQYSKNRQDMNKYCNNCNKETSRYKSGHCKPCSNKRSEVNNKKRSGINMSVINRLSILVDKEVFDKHLYTEFNIKDVIQLHRNNSDKFIYFLLKDNELVYIGKSNGNFLSRINSHLKNKDFSDIRYRTVLTASSLDKIEKQLITKYRPKLNKEYIFNDAKYDIFDLKTEEVIRDTKTNLLSILNTSESSLSGLLSENRKKLYCRYMLLKNKPNESTFKNVLDKHTGLVERHNYITFAEKVSKNQNAVWYFMNGFTKTYMKKRYVLVE
jgi:hypothetical protein|tara:strand:- start:217 stop:1227 length:1011 start_codon:yes stop_codon:yes gene_type:complete